jgi:hypothetical protein
MISHYKALIFCVQILDVRIYGDAHLERLEANEYGNEYLAQAALEKWVYKFE